MSVNMTAFVNIDHSHINEQDIDICIENKRKTEKPGREKTEFIPPGAVTTHILRSNALRATRWEKMLTD
jgi:hypothetical protein